MNTPRFAQLALVILVLTGCSRVQFAYSQLDWVIPYYLEEYVDFTDAQRDVVDEKVDALLAWHCRTQLGVYADLLRSANADLQSGAMTRPRLDEYTVRLEGHWRAIMQQASPAVADLLLSASDEQIEELFRSFKEKNESSHAEYADESDMERRERYRERMTEELERWFGPLQSPQQQAVHSWSRRLVPLGLVGLRSREQWQANLGDVIDDRADEAAFRAGIEQLFVNPRALRSPAIQARFDENRSLALDLIHEIGASLDEEQRRHLRSQSASYARDLDELVCAPDAPGASDRNDEGMDRRWEEDVGGDP